MFRTIAVAGILLLIGCGHTPQTFPASSSGSDWHEFQGTWTAAGNRSAIPFGDNRQASIAELDGSLLLAGQSRPVLGFRAEAIVLNDSGTGMVGRAVWTDEHGDKAFSELRGDGTATKNKIIGTFLGGTGRYSGATGTYEFSWRFVLESDDGSIQGQSIGLVGKIRVGSSHPTPDTGTPRS